YVAFSTGEQLVPSDTNDNVDVYARDMTKPASSASAYSLVSAKDGGDTPATYAHPTSDPAPVLSGQRNPGSEASPGTSISASGQYVVFRTVEWNSDLPDASDPPTATSGTPPGQVLVRDVWGHHTYLITQTSQTDGATQLGQPAGGAAGPLAISGDGSTVAWVG